MQRLWDSTAHSFAKHFLLFFSDNVSIVEPKDDVIPETPYSEQKGGKLPEQQAPAAAAPPAAVPMA